MYARYKTAVIWLVSAALVMAFSPAPLALARGGGGGGGHGGGGFGGGGFGGGGHGGGGWGGGGGHFSGGSFGGAAHFGGYGGGFSGGHVGGWSGANAAIAHGNFNSFNGQAGNFNRSFAGNNFNRNFAGNSFNRGEGWWNNRGFDQNRYFGYGGYGLYGWPWYALGWGWGGYGWPDYYDYGYAPYGDVYGGYYDAGIPYTSAAYSPASAVVETGPPETGTSASDFYSEAIAAFRQGDYGNATRLAGHAAIDDPQNPDVHILAMLGLFALGDYRGAAMEAHAVAAIGHIPDWPTLYGFYDNVTPYEQQLRKLEKFVDEHPSAAEGRFLLGFQYMMMGHKNAAKDQLAAALKLTPHDPLAAKLLQQEGGTVPAGINVPQSSASPPADRQTMRSITPLR